MTRKLYFVFISDRYNSNEIKDKLLELIGSDPEPIIVWDHERVNNYKEMITEIVKYQKEIKEV